MFKCDSFARFNNDSICVETGEIQKSKEPLYTSFVYSCTVLTFEYEIDNEKYNFLAHIDAYGDKMKERLNKTISQLPLTTVKTFNLYYGPLCKKISCVNNCECDSAIIAKDVLKNNNVQEHQIKEKYLDKWQTEISIPENQKTYLKTNIDRIFPDNSSSVFKSMQFVQKRSN